MTTDTNTLYHISRLRDLLAYTDQIQDPFLYHLPNLLGKHDFSQIDPGNAVTFCEYALKHQKEPIVMDALRVLNQLIEPTDGTLKTPSRLMFVENRNFSWKELGDFKDASSVIMHIFHKTIFFMSLGK